MPDRIRERVDRAIQEKVFPGCVIATLTKGERTCMPFGALTYGDASPLVADDTVYDLASVTKSIPTASLALRFLSEGKLRLEDALISYVPEVASEWREKITIAHLLRYEIAGLRLSTLKDKSLEDLLESVYAAPLSDPPGTKRQYTNLPALFLGLVVERVGGFPLSVLAQKYLFAPLDMKSATFFPLKEDIASIAPTEIEGSVVRGVPHDESARVFALEGRAAGHAGLFSNARDLVVFLEALLAGGDLAPVLEGAQRGLGWQVNDTNFMGAKAGQYTFGKTGFTGTSILADEDRKMALVILSNRTYPKRPPEDSAIFQFRRDIADIVFEETMNG